MTAADDLARLRAILDTDEQVALEALADTSMWSSMAKEEHDYRHQPPRVLRQVEAHRRILARHHPVRALPSYVPGAPQPGDLVCAGCGSKGNGRGETLWPCPDVQDLASIYNVEVGNVER